MDKTYAQRLHKYELVLRGFFLNALRLQIKPYKDFFNRNGYLGSIPDLIATDSLSRAYIESYKYISSSEMYNEWLRQSASYKKTGKALDDEDGWLLVESILNNLFIQSAYTAYNIVRNDLNETSVKLLTNFVNDARAKGYSDSEIMDSINSQYENTLRNRAGVFGATEANGIMMMSKRNVAAQFFTQKGIVGYKTWFTRRDEAVRHTHVEVDNRTLPIDTSFVLNRPRGWGIEFADVPGDPQLSVGNRANCRCYCEFHSDPNEFKPKKGGN